MCATQVKSFVTGGTHLATSYKGRICKMCATHALGSRREGVDARAVREAHRLAALRLAAQAPLAHRVDDGRWGSTVHARPTVTAVHPGGRPRPADVRALHPHLVPS